MKRREFITLLGGALTMVPRATFSQSGRLRLVGLLLSQFEGNQEANDRIAAIEPSGRIAKQDAEIVDATNSIVIPVIMSQVAI